jgi:hypothetical protein
MNDYIVKNSSELTEAEIKTILENWDVEEWKRLKPEISKNLRSQSSLTDSGLNILCIQGLISILKYKSMKSLPIMNRLCSDKYSKVMAETTGHLSEIEEYRSDRVLQEQIQ